jgi:LysR family glycine cleavage system transcriptional activator/LysR family transcriptional regulator of beta-lactamase
VVVRLPAASVSRPKTKAFEEWLIEELSAPQTRSNRATIAAVGRRLRGG